MEHSSATGVVPFIAERKHDIKLLNTALLQQNRQNGQFMAQPISRKRKRELIEKTHRKTRTRSFYPRKYRRGNNKRKILFGAPLLACRAKRRKTDLRKWMTNVDLAGSAQTSPARLITHVWHAKRMQMMSKSGWYMPLKCNDRSTQAIANIVWPQNRDAKHGTESCIRENGGCVIQDISFNHIFRVVGARKSILEALKMHLVIDAYHIRNSIVT